MKELENLKKKISELDEIIGKLRFVIKEVEININTEKRNKKEKVCSRIK